MKVEWQYNETCICSSNRARVDGGEWMTPKEALIAIRDYVGRLGARSEFVEPYAILASLLGEDE